MKDSNIGYRLNSWKKFSNIYNQNKVDVKIATHPFFWYGKSRLEITGNITDEINPFVISEAGYRYYEKRFYDYAVNNWIWTDSESDKGLTLSFCKHDIQFKPLPVVGKDYSKIYLIKIYLIYSGGDYETR